MRAASPAEPTFARTILHDPARSLVGLAALVAVLAVTISNAPQGFWAQAPRTWVADFVARRDVTVAQPLAVAYILGSIACCLGAGAWLWRAPLERRWAGLVLGILPLAGLALTGGVGLALGAVVLVGALMWATGYLVLARAALAESTPLERFLLRAATGLGVVVFVALAVGLVGWLNPVVVLVAMLLVAGLTYRALARGGRPRLRIDGQAWRLDRGTVVLVTALLLLLQVVVPYVVAPEITYDAVYYHLTIVAEFVRRGAVVQLPNIFASTFPLVPHLAYTLGALLGGLDAAKFVHFAVGLASVGAVYALTRRVTGNARSGLFGALIWASTPLVLWELSTAYVDMFAALFTTLLLLCAVLWMDTRQPLYALLGGVFAGLDLGVKPNMAFVAAPIYVAILVLEARRSKDFGLWIGSGVLAGIVGIPWYVRAYLLTGNPVFPFLNGVFRSSQWAPINDNFNFDLFGMGHQPIDFALLPWRLTLQTGHFSEVPDGALGVLPLVLTVTPFLVVLGRRRVRLVALYLLVAISAWALYAQYARYFLAALPAAAVLLGAFLGRLSNSRVWPIRGTGYAVALALAVASVPIFLASFWNVPGFVPWTVDLGRESRTTYLERALRHYDTYEWVKNNLPAGDASKILGVGFGEWPIAYSPVPVYIGHMTYSGQQILTAPSAAEAVDRVRAAGFHYVLIDYFPKPPPWRSSYPIAQDAVIDSTMKLLYANNYVYLYQVMDGPPDVRANPPVTVDATLQDVSSAPGSAWTSFGTLPSAATNPTCNGLRVGRGAGVLQTFKAQPNTLYTFQAEMESDSQVAGSGILEVSWKRATVVDSQLNLEVDGLTSTSAPYQMSSTSPPDATEGSLYVTSFDDDGVCVHNASGALS